MSAPSGKPGYQQFVTTSHLFFKNVSIPQSTIIGSVKGQSPVISTIISDLTHWCAHQCVKSDIIVEITGDCPLTDPIIVDWGIDTFLKNKCDVVTNCWYPGFPEGADIQVFNLSSLEWVYPL